MYNTLDQNVYIDGRNNHYILDHNVTIQYFITVLIWILFEGVNCFIQCFIIFTLSRINREDVNGRTFILPNLVKSVLVGLFIVIIFIITIFGFNIQIYFYFYTVEVICFWMISKMICVLLIFDKLYSKT